MMVRRFLDYWSLVHSAVVLLSIVIVVVLVSVVVMLILFMAIMIVIVKHFPLFLQGSLDY